MEPLMVRKLCCRNWNRNLCWQCHYEFMIMLKNEQNDKNISAQQRNHEEKQSQAVS